MILTKIYAKEIKKQRIDMSLSENPLGCSLAVVKEISKINIKTISQYPDTTKLINLLAGKFGVPSQSILLGCGAEQLIKLIAMTFLEKNSTALIQEGSFGVFSKECQLTGAKIKFFNPENNLVTIPKAKIVIICNPNNPTGELLDEMTINNILNIANKSLIVIDEANGEFSNISFINRAVASQNCLILKTFSKVFGLAGLRIGFAIGNPNLISKLSISQQTFPVSSLACLATQTAVRDKVFIEKTIDFIAKERKFLTRELQKRGFTVSKSITNTIFVKTSYSSSLVKLLNKLEVCVIDGSFFPGIKDKGFRIAIRDKKTNRLFLEKIDEALSCMKLKKLITSKSI